MSEGDDIVAAFLGPEGFRCDQCQRTAHVLHSLWMVFCHSEEELAPLGDCCSENCANKMIAAQPEPRLCFAVPPGQLPR